MSVEHTIAAPANPPNSIRWVQKQTLPPFARNTQLNDDGVLAISDNLLHSESTFTIRIAN